MPIFMDRHDVSQSVNAENVAQLHKEDLKIQHQFKCRGLTYWFDDIRKIAFCLIEAPDKESIYNMHHCAHGEVPNQILEVDENIVESFLGRIRDPDKTDSSDSNIISDPAQRTLMVVRYKTLSLSGIRYSQTGENIQKTISSTGDLLNHFGGRLVRYDEGYLLISFKSACQCPHWGYVLKGKLTTTDAEGLQETVAANDIFYWPSGHNVKVDDDAEIIMFSPQHEHTHVINHMIEKTKG